MEDEVSEFAIDFGQTRLSEALKSLAKVSPSLSEEIRNAADSGSILSCMGKASRALEIISGKLFSSDEKGLEKIRKELKSSMGKSYNKINVSAILSAHSSGLGHMSSVDGLSQTIFFHFSRVFLERLEKYAVKKKVDKATLESATGLINDWIRTLLSQYSPGDKDNPIRSLAFVSSEDDALKWTGELIMRSTLVSEDLEVKQLIRDSFRN